MTAVASTPGVYGGQILLRHGNPFAGTFHESRRWVDTFTWIDASWRWNARVSQGGLMTRQTMILAFDASCGKCRRIAQEVGDTAKDIEVRSLYDLDIQEMRRKALGENAPWAPTLIANSGSRVRAWTGPKMAARLLVSVEPSVSWRLMQSLSELRRSSEMDPPSPSRSAFLKGIFGAGVAMSFVRAAPASAEGRGSVGDAPEASPAPWTENSEENLRIAGRLANGGDLANVLLAEQVAASTDGASRAVLDALQRGDADAGSVSPQNESHRRLQVPGNPTASYVVGLGERNGRRTATLSAVLDDRHVAVVRQFIPERKGIRAEAEVWEMSGSEGDESLTLIAGSTHGELDTLEWDTSSCSTSCCCHGPSCGCKAGRMRCTSWDLNCVGRNCGQCALTCVGGPLLCAACVLAFCFTSAATCCTNEEWSCRVC